MNKGELHIRSGKDAEIALLRQEIKTLSEQVKRLVKAESRLYQYQEDLDAQLKEYKDLYELNRKLNETFDIETIFRHTVDYLTQNLDYERAVILRCLEGTGDFRVAALAGYYDDREMSCISAHVLKHDSPLLSLLVAGREYLLCTKETNVEELLEFSRDCFLDEFFIFPLGAYAHPYALLAVGNSADKADFFRKVDDRHGTLVSMGNVVGLVGSSVEKNLLHGALLESEYRLKSVVENLAEGLLLIDPRSEALQWNNAALHIHGYSRHQKVLSSFDCLLQIFELSSLNGNPLPIEQSPVKRVLSGEDFREYEILIRRRDTDWQRIFSYGGVLIRDVRGEPLIGLLTIRDITDRKQAEVERERLIDELERSNRELQQFAYVAAHDLQEPLRNVTRYVQLLATRFKGQVDEKGEQYVHFAVEGANRIHALIDGLLAYSELGARATELKPVSMLMVVKEAIDQVRQSVEDSGAVITMDAMPEVYGNSNQLVQLVQNLLGNAITYRKKGSTPSIHISAQKGEDFWRFGVHDNGIGIEPEYYEKIFSIFQRLSSRSEYPGTGIGLAICRKIVERHGGKIWVESIFGQGASFYFTIPIRLVPSRYASRPIQ